MCLAGTGKGCKTRERRRWQPISNYSSRWSGKLRHASINSTSTELFSLPQNVQASLYGSPESLRKYWSLLLPAMPFMYICLRLTHTAFPNLIFYIHQVFYLLCHFMISELSKIKYSPQQTTLSCKLFAFIYNTVSSQILFTFIRLNKKLCQQHIFSKTQLMWEPLCKFHLNFFSNEIFSQMKSSEKQHFVTSKYVLSFCFLLPHLKICPLCPSPKNEYSSSFSHSLGLPLSS